MRFQLLADFVGKPDHRAIIQVGGQGPAFIPAERQDVGLLAVQIAGILGVDLQLFDDIRGETRQFRPDPGECGEIHLGQAQQVQGRAADAILADGKPCLAASLGVRDRVRHCFT